jgi:hypothetical protein
MRKKQDFFTPRKVKRRESLDEIVETLDQKGAKLRNYLNELPRSRLRGIEGPSCERFPFRHPGIL